VRTAWLLDAYGDAGDAQKLGEAFGTFAASAEAITTAFGGSP